MKSVIRSAFFFLVLSALGSVHFLFAQGTDLGTIRGTVKDASGAVIADANVIVTDIDTNASRQTKVNGAGDFEVFGLKSGRYKVSVTASGMNTQEINDVVVNGSATVGVNVTLRVSGGSEKVEVSAAAVTINTENPTISDSVGHQAVIDLPRDTRDIYSFLYLNPNITQADVNGDFKFIGGQSYGGSFSVDGQRSNGGIFGQPTDSKPSLEAVDEVNVLSNSFSAEYAGTANIRITTKRGQNEFHGSAFYNNANSALAALSLQDLAGIADFEPNAFASKYPTPYFNINDLGGAIGGPIKGLKNTWFFAAYERDYNVSPVNISTTKLPHPSLWTGDFSMLDDSAKPDVPPGTVLTPQEMATDTVGGLGLQFIQIPSELLNPSVQSLITKYFPHIGVAAPIDSSSGLIPSYQTQMPGRDTLDTGSLRIDHDFSEKDHVYVSYNTSAETSATSPVVSPYIGLGLTKNNRQNQTVALSYTRIFRPTLVNELRGGFNKENLLRHSNTTLEGFLSSIGFDAADIAAYGSVVGQFALGTFGHPAINFSNTFATFTNGGRNTYRPENQGLITFGDTLTWVLGKHNLRMGLDFVRNQAVDGFALNRGNPRGSMTYTQPDTCANDPCSNANPFTEFLLGLPPTSASYVLQARPPMNVYNWEEGYFAQDDWKISSRLTLNLGFRYDLATPFIEKSDLLINFDPTGANPNGNPGVFIIPSAKTLPYVDTRIASYGYITASQAGLGRGLVRTDKNNIAPRLGFAYKIGDKSVLRAGWGVFYPTSAAQGIRDAIGTNPFNQGVTSRTTLEGWPSPSQDGISPITGGTLKGFGNSVTANAIPLGIQTPRIQQYNVTFEREIVRDGTLRVSYLGTHMNGLIAGKDLDELPPNTTPFGTTQGDGVTICDPTQGDCAYSPADLARLPFPLVGEFLLTYGNFGHGNSNSFQTEFTRRYKSGLMLDMSYTYLDQKTSALDTANSSLGGIGYNPFSPNSDYGTDGYISKHRFIAYGIYDLPIGRKHRIGSSFSKWADTLIGGWQTTFNMFAKSGQGFTPFWICDDCDPVEPGNIAVSSIDAVGDFNAEPSFRPVVLNNNINTGKKGSNAIIWNSSAFGLPSVGADLLSNPAVAKRNMLTGPGAWGVNLGIHKAFPIGERVVATLGADFDNIFNHPLFAPDADFGGGGGTFSQLGDFNIRVDQTTGVVLPIAASDVNINPLFGQLTNSFPQEGVLSQRTIRLRLRITF
ncbi:MAG TPA: carboxypeptidase-like regulatory domain-containing protein [Candidatus Sulfotelmatobacter sp.]|nr:carboxypeptidase-like regulatory domain-containing protein [Candidatus Sulfotelmatobacter sp.]